MADEVFALSPISARANLPSEEDYDAIREAFMETSRGRWFLGEYAKRNRNADTRLVLDAVERIEETLAAQNLAAKNLAAQKPPEPLPDNRLAEALSAIRSALGEARAAASTAIDALALEQHLAPVRKGARVIREISWRLREVGADGRICDLIDSQVSAIEGACGQISSAKPKDAMSAAFDLVEDRIGKFAERDASTPAPPAPAEAVPSSPSAPTAKPAKAAGAKKFRTASATTDAKPAATAPAMATVAATKQDVDAAKQDVEVIAEGATVTTEATEITSEAAAAHDEAVLDMVALAMATPDPFDRDEFSEIKTVEIEVAKPPPVKRKTSAAKAKPAAAAKTSPAEAPSLQPAFDAPPEPTREPSPARSLGAAILANGIVQAPSASPPDPLAPIRRMSQAEKIAFFS
ncbi:MAG TPA: hypothetical protein VFH41_06285 [Bradyrhizobium sp.]|nr:hypothetical protein [Bradyrhizobium sp.]